MIYEKEGRIPLHPLMGAMHADLMQERDRYREALIQLAVLLVDRPLIDRPTRDRLSRLVQDGLGQPVRSER